MAAAGFDFRAVMRVHTWNLNEEVGFVQAL